MADFALSSTLTAAAIVLAIFGAAAGLAWFAAARRLVLDRPNERSSHDRATPRAGGLAVVLPWAFAILALGAAFGAEAMGMAPAALYGFVGLTLLVFCMGLADDLFSLPPLAKLAAQTAAAIGLVLIVGPIERISAPYAEWVALGPLAAPLTVIGIVAFMNMFNFMDGLNGMAAGVGAVASVSLAFIASLSGVAPVVWLAALLTPAILGFLIFNAPDARLFLGDNGSQPLGFIFAGLAVIGARAEPAPFSAYLLPMLFMPFVFDTTFTLVHRIIRKRNILRAHKEHLYQLLHQTGYSHGAVAALYGVATAFCAVGAMVMTIAPVEAELSILLATLPAFAGLGVFVLGRARKTGVLAAGSEPAVKADIPLDRIRRATGRPSASRQSEDLAHRPTAAE
ncbi:MAG: glycosyltransferase family 4 protein [Parvularculaceae bacterium]